MVLRNNPPALFFLVLLCFAACNKKGTLAINDPCGEDSSCAEGLCYAGTCISPSSDTDSDGLTNLFEVQLGSNPYSDDSDNDLKPDPTELGPNFVLLDWDGDGLADIIESDVLDPDGDCVPNEFDPQNNISGFDEEKQVIRLCPLTGVCGVNLDDLFVSCDETALVCDASNIPEYEEHEVTCDGLDNDCDGATDEKLNGNFGPELNWGMGHNWQLRRASAIAYEDNNGQTDILIFGGEVPTFNLEDPTAPGAPQVTGELWGIDSSTGEAKLLEMNGDSPSPRSGARFVSNAELEGLVLVGGRASLTPSANQQEAYPGDLWFLNYDDYAWTEIDLSPATTSLALEGIAFIPLDDTQSLSSNGSASFYLFGGHNATEVSDRVYRLDIDGSVGVSNFSATIVEIGVLSKTLTQASAVLVEGGTRLLLIGGKEENGDPAGIVALDFNDLKNDLVTEVPGVENAGTLNSVSGAAVTSVSGTNGQLVVALGGVDISGLIKSKIYVREASTWTEHDLEAPLGRTNATGIPLNDGSFVFVGGLNDSGEPDVSIEVTVPSVDKPEVKSPLALDQWLIAGVGSSTARSPAPTQSLLFPGLLPGFTAPYSIGSYWHVSGSDDGTAKIVRGESTLNGKPMSNHHYLSFSSSTYGASDKEVYAFGFELDLVNGEPQNQFSEYGLFELDLVSGNWARVLEAQDGPGRLNGAEVVYDVANGLVFVVGGVQVNTNGSVIPTSSIWTLDPEEGLQTQVYGQTPSFSVLPWGIVSTWHNEVSRTLVLAIARGKGDYALGVFHMDDYTYEDIQISTSLPSNPGVPVRLSILDAGHQALMLYPDSNEDPLGRYLHADFNTITDSAHSLSSIDKFRNNGTYFFSKNLDAGIYVGGMYMDDGRVPTRGLVVDLGCLF